jgi:flagellar motor switch/type III secretory pathway protein FliN
MSLKLNPHLIIRMDNHQKVEEIYLQCQQLEHDMKNLPTNLRLADQYMAIEQELENIQELLQYELALEKRITRTQLNISILVKMVEKYKLIL